MNYVSVPTRPKKVERRSWTVDVSAKACGVLAAIPSLVVHQRRAGGARFDANNAQCDLLQYLCSLYQPFFGGSIVLASSVE